MDSPTPSPSLPVPSSPPHSPLPPLLSTIHPSLHSFFPLSSSHLSPFLPSYISNSFAHPLLPPFHLLPSLLPPFPSILLCLLAPLPLCLLASLPPPLPTTFSPSLPSFLPASLPSLLHFYIPTVPAHAARTTSSQISRWNNTVPTVTEVTRKIIAREICVP